jgi:hypothetical protein
MGMAMVRFVQLVVIHPAPPLGERIYHPVQVVIQGAHQAGYGEHSQTRVDHDHVKSLPHLDAFFLAEQPLSSCALAYLIPVLPMSIVRWYFFARFYSAQRVVDTPVKPLFGASMIFNLSGAFDVLVFLLTRRGLLLFEKDLPQDELIAMIPDPMESQQALLGHISDSSGKA